MGDEERLRELCEELLGPVHAEPESENGCASSGFAHILGLDKRALLKNEVLKDMSRSRANQRLVSEFHDLLSQQQQHATAQVPAL